MNGQHPFFKGTMTVFPELRRLSKKMRENKHSVWTFGKNLLSHVFPVVFKFYQSFKVFEKKEALYVAVCKWQIIHSCGSRPFPQQRRQACLPDSYLFPSLNPVSAGSLFSRPVRGMWCLGFHLLLFLSKNSEARVAFSSCLQALNCLWIYPSASRGADWRREVSFSFSSALPPCPLESLSPTNTETVSHFSLPQPPKLGL